MNSNHFLKKNLENLGSKEIRGQVLKYKIPFPNEIISKSLGSNLNFTF